MGNSQAAGMKGVPPMRPPAGKEGGKSILPLPEGKNILPLPEKKEHPVVKQVLDLLKDEKMSTVAITGMGGIGKTYILQQIKNHPSVAARFDIVLWWPFGCSEKPPDVEALQVELANLLGLTLPPPAMYWGEKIHDFLNPKKFLLLLDGLWNPIDLVRIGVPFQLYSGFLINPNHKVVLTTRLEWTHRGMYSSIFIPVPCLDWEESWLLFQNTFGEKVLYFDQFLQSRAVQVVDKCGGLPLAIIAAARAMSAMEWEKVMFMPIRSQLREVCDQENDIFPSLKLSYDHTRNETMRQCFLLCSLWPENFPIPLTQLILCCMGHGLLHRWGYGSVGFSFGECVINDLARDGLLELATVNIHKYVHVKMHCVLREMALSIASQEKNWMVYAGVGLQEAPYQAEIWKEAQKISLMYNKIKDLPPQPECPNLSTLMLQHNPDLYIPDGFFRCMPSLEYLDLSNTADISPPLVRSILPNLTGLLQLRYLDLSRTTIESLPEEMVNLRKLEYLLLSETRYLRSIPDGLVSKLENLKLLDLYNSHYNMSDGAADDICERSNKTLWTTLGATLATASDVQRLYEATYVDLWRLWLKDLEGVNSLNLFEIFIPEKKTEAVLQEFTLSSCTSLEEFIMTDENLYGRPSVKKVMSVHRKSVHGCERVEVLALLDLPNLERITCKNWPFFSIRSLTVSTCNKLKNLTWIKELNCLEHLSVEACYGMEKVIDGIFRFPRLNSLILRDLPNLEFISSYAVIFSSLEIFRLAACPKLKQLPFSSKIAKKIFRGIHIRGSEQWWEDLVWEEDDIKLLLQPYFKADSTLLRMEKEPKTKIDNINN